MKKLEVGDRVAVYDARLRLTGKIRKFICEDLVEIEYSDRSGSEQYAIQQCRRLKPKRKPREFWLVFEPHGPRWISTESEFACKQGSEIIRVREVRGKSK